MEILLIEMELQLFVCPEMILKCSEKGHLNTCPNRDNCLIQPLLACKGYISVVKWHIWTLFTW
jgi:hypothetical protein